MQAQIENYRFRVWDYPVKELYRHLSKKINETRPVKTPEEGYRRVLDEVDEEGKAKLAFIWNSREV